MGVDASYMYGYGAKVNKVEWDFEWLRHKYNLSDKVTHYWYEEYTYGEFFELLEQAVNDEIDEDKFELDWYEIGQVLGFKYCYPEYDDMYIYFNHFDVTKMFPDSRLKDLDEAAIEYAREIGVKNPEIFKWIEFGYFS